MRIAVILHGVGVEVDGDHLTVRIAVILHGVGIRVGVGGGGDHLTVKIVVILHGVGVKVVIILQLVYMFICTLFVCKYQS